MSPIDVGGILVALIAAFGALMASRSASRAATANSRFEAEKEAYERARKFDVQTIAHQNIEIEQLREDNDALTKELREVKKRLARLEDASQLTLEALLRERLEELDERADGA